MIKNILTIAGTDPSGGAGIQADMKTFSALGTYAMSVITAVVAQNTQGVRSYRTMDAEFVGEQIDVVFEDITVDAVKIGMLANADIVKVVASKLKQYNVKNVVLDPVMVAKSGDPLIDETAVAAIRDILLPQVTIVTPNIPEACVLLNKKEPISLDEMEVEAKNILQLNPQWVLLKGGHLTGNICRDVLRNSQETYEFVGERIITKNDHGTGCTLSSAITALLPTMTVPKAVEKAKAFLEQALQSSYQLSVGHGHGPLHHFCNLWK
ncbi:Hydroxymethylpyrimidine/phosphomethylpyrimidine kinase (ThiD) (PDB:1Y9X) (PUBMED:17351295) [Commensalibacter communis]|uniref:bifunctional hydroxymethylpyrimidine kinase/phosphomethylpyrimidine kinase n=1 Tax=Commensalibacter communis TaxID=2972786 RepID=UPI0022FF8F48|nr:bifunctional hydroxymethylpyrimidine kinase/phosphomethylpyrimidine kinase [Commensalibacter communis]CAI3936624.1 Hydroxymethylpyrimidine/phosphomethylpyrimidine kinase (ThiD) (PDB:1Y9X) (PUBMED:17351295) [Commensalibacter communis]